MRLLSQSEDFQTLEILLKMEINRFLNSSVTTKMLVEAQVMCI